MPTETPTYAEILQEAGAIDPRVIELAYERVANRKLRERLDVLEQEDG